MKKNQQFPDRFRSGIKKLFLVMKLTTLFLFLTVMAYSANTYSQETLFDLTVKNASIIDVFDKIEHVTEFGFLFRSDQLDLNKRYNLDFNKSDIETILNEILNKDEFSYKIIDKHIVITREFSISEQDGKLIKVSGKVTEASGVSLPGVTVVISGTTNGTITDNDGSYALANVPEKATLTFSFIGKKTQQIEVSGRSIININIEEETTGIEEVVVVGYGTQSVKKVSGAVTNVAAKDFNQGVARNVGDLLQGKVAGLTITSVGGDVTSTQTIRLRGTSSLTGSSSPFVVIDGVPGMDLWSVSPDDIESISVLKDASATAIYGSRSASGVILVTTKKGKEGKTNIQYNAYVAADFGAKTPDVLTAAQWRDYAAKNELDVTGIDKGANTVWFDEMMRTGISQNHNLSISGGLKNGSYRASLTYQDRQGVMIDNFLTRYNGLFSVTQKALNDRLTVTLNGGHNQSDYQSSDGYNSTLAYNMLPVYPLKNPDGTYFDIKEWDQGNPVNNMKNNSSVHKTSLLYTNVKIDLEILKDLNAGVNLFKQREANDVSTYHASTTQAGRNDNGNANRGNQLWDKSLFEFTLDYSKVIGENSFKLLGGYSYEENIYQSEGASNRNFISDIFGANNLSIGEDYRPTDVNSYKSSNKLISFFGRLNYSFKDKYILTGTIRDDGSSKFGKNHKWGYFPSVSAAWRISDESFMESVSFINDLKFRTGYGVVGNQEGIDSYNSLALYSRGDEFFDNGKWHNSFKYDQNDNPDLKWEQTASFNTGIDFGMFENRISGSVDYYVKNTTDLLYVYQVPVPPYLYPTMLANVGDMSNKGIEIVINGEIMKTKDFRWTASINLAHNKNTVTRLSNDAFQTDYIKTGDVVLRGSGYLTSSIIQEGQEVGTFYNLKYNGIDENGKFIIEDITPDGEITPADYTYIGHANPRLTYGIQNSMSYKKFDFSFFLRGLQGNDVLNTPRIQFANAKWLPGGNVLAEALTNGIKDNPLFSSYYIENGSFLRLDNASLAYNFDLNKMKGVNKFRVYVTGQNLFTITKFTGPDPEVDMNGLSPGMLQMWYIPKPKTVSLGVEISF